MIIIIFLFLFSHSEHVTLLDCEYFYGHTSPYKSQA